MFNNYKRVSALLLYPFQFLVEATDNGNPPRSSQTTVTLTIDRNTPIFGGPYELNLAENTVTGTIIQTVLATVSGGTGLVSGVDCYVQCRNKLTKCYGIVLWFGVDGCPVNISK